MYTAHRPEIPNQHIHGVVMKTQVAQDGRWSKLHATKHKVHGQNVTKKTVKEGSDVLVGARDAVQAFDALDDVCHGVWQG